jgi:hypothetical protein
MYKAGEQFPLLEEDAVSDTNDARQIEKFLAGTGLPYTFFRPQVRTDGVCVCVCVCVYRWVGGSLPLTCSFGRGYRVCVCLGVFGY